MALRNVVKKGDPILGKKCRTVEEINGKITDLLDDMIETMHENKGVGIAAPQVGMLKRMCVCEPEEGQVVELINPEIIKAEGEQEGYEGCLSVPDMIGRVKRPEMIRVTTLNRDGEKETYEFTGFGAIVASHEIDHLDGILYVEKAADLHDPALDEEQEEAGK
ncbi:MAG: peptide deformylase [Eubacteriaceae bacterium]|nr:peptide deformylase [Eubacteriaceae bacterium]